MVLKKLFSLMFLAVFLFVFSFSASAASVMDKSVIIVGTEGTYPPFEYYDESNKLTGFDIELIEAIGAKIGKEIQVSDMAFDGLIPALISGKIDLIAAALNATEDRKKAVDFSGVYQTADASIVTKSGNDGIKSLDDLQGKSIGVQLGTTEDSFITKYSGKVDVKRYQKVDDAVREVVLGRIDGVLLDSPIAVSYVENESFEGLKIAFKEMINGPEEGFSLAVRKADPQFLEALNKALGELESSGKLPELRAKYKLD